MTTPSRISEAEMKRESVPPQIKVELTANATPRREWDYVAYFDGQEEAGLRGYGETKQAAIDDLLHQYEGEEITHVQR